MIGDNTLGSNDEIRAGIAEYDVRQQFRIKAQEKTFKGYDAGGKSEIDGVIVDNSTWEVLANAIRTNSSEGLNAREKEIFFEAGLGEQQE